ncbi:sushi, von Willebrand factor type A, EGF and pentraxin domain-containing protein 1 [Trichonephila clavipes]|uniref:Sushi, von Willebrand factor type A, EGF and pentraxin domain-containing protein 1 n=1 Tax=Trichonephila clavipes TaxID=2585209 RepID=A0A8X6W685_TRICX|nr:sushi, von Willebrand factor type A, EGF and pentraxin domain-containing protein 1 [Trichonephila clavipes]
MCGKPGITPNCAYNNDLSKQDYKVGDVVSYHCLSGLCYAPNLVPRRCQENGSWSGTIPFCHKPSGSESVLKLSLIEDQNRYDAGPTMDKINDTCISTYAGPNTFWIATLTKSFRIVAVRVIFPDRIKEISVMVEIMEGNSSRSPCESHQRKSDSERNGQLFVCKKGAIGDKVIISQQLSELYNENERFGLCEVFIFLQPHYACLRPDIPYMGTGRRTASPIKYVFECAEDYELVGDKETVCRSDGTWSSGYSTCKKRTHCGELPTVANGFVRANFTTINSTAWLECEEGYRPLSDHPIHCLPTGAWTSLSLRCEIIKCDPNPVIPHGKGILPSGFLYGSKLHITCDKGYVAVESWPRECDENGTWGNLNICSQIICDSSNLEANDRGQWVPLNETISIRVLICQTNHHIEGSPAVTQCLPNGSWSYTTAVCRKTPQFDTWNSEWTPSTILLSAVAVGAGTAICILCLAMCFLVLKKRRQSKINSTVFHVGVSDSILYHEGSKEQQYKANTYEDLIELRHNPTNTKPRKPSSALPHLPIPPMDTDPVYAQPFETSTVFPKLSTASAGGDIYTAHIYAEPIDSQIPLSGPSAFNSASETWLRSGAKKFGRKMSLPVPEDSDPQTNQTNSSTLRLTGNSSMKSKDVTLDNRGRTTQYESKTPVTMDLISNSVYLDTKDVSFKPKKDLDQFKMIDNDIYQDDYFSNV